MSKGTHTPGPWVADGNGVILGGEYAGTSICETYKAHWLASFGRNGKEAYAALVRDAEANAQLIAAAPELLEACRERLLCDEMYEQGTSEWHQSVDCADAMMHAAIAKATGNK